MGWAQAQSSHSARRSSTSANLASEAAGSPHWIDQVMFQLRPGGGGVSEADGSVTIIDTVSYENLIPGQIYTVKGELVDKETGEGTGILAEISFTAEGADGSVLLVFSFDGSGYIGKELVAFERIYDEAGNLIGIHEDLEDLAQTVKVIAPELPPKTGDDSHLAVWAAVAVGALIALIFVSRHFIKDDDKRRK